MYQPVSQRSIFIVVTTATVVLATGFAMGYRLGQFLYDHLTGRQP